MCGKICGKIERKKIQIGTTIGMVVDIDPLIMIVVCGKICNNKTGG